MVSARVLKMQAHAYKNFLDSPITAGLLGVHSFEQDMYGVRVDTRGMEDVVKHA